LNTPKLITDKLMVKMKTQVKVIETCNKKDSRFQKIEIKNLENRVQ